MKKRVLIGVALALLGLAAWTYLRQRQAIEHQNAKVVRISGNIEVTDAEVSFKIAGRVQARFVSEGEIVEAGQIVALLDSSELSQEVELRKAEVRAARALLAELEAGFRPEEIAQGEAALRQAQAEQERLRVDHARQLRLLQREVISNREYESTRAAHEVARARVRSAEEQLSLLRKGSRQERIDRARAQLDQALKAEQLSTTRLEYATLHAPLSGVVLSDHVEAGEVVAAGTPIVTLGDLHRVWLRGYIDETDLGRVKIGQKVSVFVDSYPDQAYPGLVSFIAAQSEFTPKNVQTAKERVKLVYRIKVDIDNPDQELKPGMPADAEILIKGEES